MRAIIPVAGVGSRLRPHTYSVPKVLLNVAGKPIIGHILDTIIGAGFDEMRWPRPVRPGDELHVETEVLEVRPSKSRPDQGVIKVRTTTSNQHGEPVQVSIGNLIVLRRTDSPRETHGYA